MGYEDDGHPKGLPLPVMQHTVDTLHECVVPLPVAHHHLRRSPLRGCDRMAKALGAKVTALTLQYGIEPEDGVPTVVSWNPR